MEEVKRIKLIRTPQLEDVPELIYRIQTLLPVNEAARTCVLNKSWLHAWSTIPTLRFHQSLKLSTDQQKKYQKLICRTLQRYRRDNIPVTSFDLHFGIVNQKSAFLGKKWVRTVASRSCLKELHLTISVNYASFKLPDELLISENLDIISVKSDHWGLNSVAISNNLVINCVKLRVLKLINVRINEEALLNLLSTCILLEKIELSECKGFKKIKLKNLRYLRELKITPRRRNDSLEIYNVPNLHLFYYCLSWVWYSRKPLSFNTDSLGSVRELVLDIVIMDDEFNNVIKSKFPFLENLTLKIKYCRLNILDFTCVSMRILNISLWQDSQIAIQVNASKLVFFCYKGKAIPSLLFANIAPDHIELTLELKNPIDQSFFLKMRELLNLSSNFKIDITTECTVPFNIDIDDVRRRITFPAMNVEQLTLRTNLDKGLREHSLFLDAVFLTCQPNYFEANQGEFERYFRKLLVKWRMELKTRKESWPHLKDVRIKNPDDGEWETLTMFSRSASVNPHLVKFKLTWFSS